MSIPAALAADLALLNEVLDETAPDLTTTLLALVAQAERAVPSYLGISVRALHPTFPPLEITTMETDLQVAQIKTSLRLSPAGAPSAETQGSSSIVLTLFAAQPGALVDLAADLAWLTGEPLSEVRIDEDLTGPRARSGQGELPSWSGVNQALGVLLGGGLTIEEAANELDARAVAAGIERDRAAAEVLATLSSTLDPRSEDFLPGEPI